MPKLGDKEELRELFVNSKTINPVNYRHFQEHFDEIQKEHAGEIIAIHEEQIIATHEFTDDLEELQTFIDEIESEHGEDVLNQAFVTHVPDPDQIHVL